MNRGRLVRVLSLVVAVAVVALVAVPMASAMTMRSTKRSTKPSVLLRANTAKVKAGKDVVLKGKVEHFFSKDKVVTIYRVIGKRLHKRLRKMGSTMVSKTGTFEKAIKTRATKTKEARKLVFIAIYKVGKTLYMSHTVAVTVVAAQ